MESTFDNVKGIFTSLRIDSNQHEKHFSFVCVSLLKKGIVCSQNKYPLSIITQQLFNFSEILFLFSSKAFTLNATLFKNCLPLFSSKIHYEGQEFCHSNMLDILFR